MHAHEIMDGLRSKIYLMGQNWWPKYYPNIQVPHSLFEPKGIVLLQEHSQGSEGCIYVFILDSAHRKILAIHFWAIILVGMRFMQSEDRNKQHFLCISSICTLLEKSQCQLYSPKLSLSFKPKPLNFWCFQNHIWMCSVLSLTSLTLFHNPYLQS